MNEYIIVTNLNGCWYKSLPMDAKQAPVAVALRAKNPLVYLVEINRN